jgi:hypothetical protein
MTDAQQLAAAIKFDAGRPGRELLRQALTAAVQRQAGNIPTDADLGEARCSTCHRAAHTPTSREYHGHPYTAPEAIPAAVLEELEELEELEAAAVATADLADASLQLAEDTMREAIEAASVLRQRHAQSLADLDHARSRTAGARRAAGVVKTADGYRRAAR